MKMNLIEMDGFLRGKCLPGDMLVNETNAKYLVRKFAESEAKCAVLAAKGLELAAEAAVVYGKYNETQMPDRDLVDMQTLQEMHDLCAGVKNPDAFLAEVRAQVWIEAKALAKSAIASDSIDHIDFLFDGKAAQLRQGATQ